MTPNDARTADRKADFEFALEPGAHAPNEARRELGSRLPPALPQPLVDDMMLLTTELVTNSVRHAPSTNAGTIDVGVLFLPTAVRVEVRDPGAGFSEMPQRPATLSEGGRGLFLVEALASRWGKGSGEQTTVWYELDVEDADRPPARSEEVDAPKAALHEDEVTGDAIEIAAELRALADATDSLEQKSRSIEADLARVTDVLKQGAERLQARQKLGPDAG